MVYMTYIAFLNKIIETFTNNKIKVEFSISFSNNCKLFSSAGFESHRTTMVTLGHYSIEIIVSSPTRVVDLSGRQSSRFARCANF
ncbi:hypothetical protein BpHYR1_002148 [Brachionus plicatilis]|uniref:Uncharacterized protein n=1 Tax=Brachionus plicatilis TaxID=10195 RepID=A0A3M7R0A8_BRAPC|nr:hypothetical protein BpHYR1_002148 [Brachionus plicatilis]